MTGGVTAPSDIEYRTTEAPCLVCVMAMPLDDDRPKHGTVRWEVSAGPRFSKGIAVSFVCSKGHSSDEDVQLLKAFPSRRF